MAFWAALLPLIAKATLGESALATAAAIAAQKATEEDYTTTIPGEVPMMDKPTDPWEQLAYLMKQRGGQ